MYTPKVTGVRGPWRVKYKILRYFRYARHRHLKIRMAGLAGTRLPNTQAIGVLPIAQPPRFLSLPTDYSGGDRLSYRQERPLTEEITNISETAKTLAIALRQDGRRRVDEHTNNTSPPFTIPPPARCRPWQIIAGATYWVTGGRGRWRRRTKFAHTAKTLTIAISTSRVRTRSRTRERSWSYLRC